MAEFSTFKLGLVLLIASLAAIVSRRLRPPYSVGLVVAGLALSLVPSAVELPLSRDLIFNVFLPPLIFEAALHLEWKDFRRDLPLTAALAFPGVAIAATAVACGMHFLIGWSWISAALFGVLIAATDPVSVIALFKEIKVERRLSMLVEGECLLNDGAAAVGFVMLAAIVAGAGDAVPPMAILNSLLWTVFGGVAVGLVVAGCLLTVPGQTEDRLVEMTLTTIAAYGSFLLAEHFHMSGVLASLSAGLLVGNFGMMQSITESSREHVLRGIQGGRAPMTLGQVATRDYTIVRDDAIAFDVIERMWRRHAFMAIVVKGVGIPHGDDVVGVITKEHIAIRLRAG